MQLVSFGPPGRERPGVLLGEAILDLGATGADLPHSWREILAADRLDDVRSLANSPATEALVALEGTRLGAPIPNASKIVCIGRNYADHAAEQNKPLPETPLLFAKATTALCGTGDPILLPPFESRPDLEVELAVVIGRRARHVKSQDAYDHVAGYMCFNDVSGRQTQYEDKQWFRGKSFDTFAPCGPYVLTRDELLDPHVLAIGSRIDDRVMQDSNTRQMVHRVPALIEYITRSMTLLPGDIITTGTPAGVGVFRDPPVFLQPGETVTVTIEKLGQLVNPVRAAHSDD
jgi:2-keto-4-pentenoate hydratase/2-oxohepta-3-ene-1,7-dioic acid hydratase in catechol pathway